MPTVARTPSKLYTLLETWDVPKSALTNLSVIEGSIADGATVRQALLTASGDALADTIVFGIGGKPRLQLNLFRPFTNDDPHSTERATAAILAELATLGHRTTRAGRKPVFVSITTIGLSDHQRDIPYLYFPLYYWLLLVARGDKKAAEVVLVGAPSKAKGNADAIIEDCVTIRPSILQDGPGRGLDQVRVGWEYLHKAPEPGDASPGSPLGYTIARKDVGTWIMEKVVKGNGEWNGKGVYITY
jgi:hypothetical protein